MASIDSDDKCKTAFLNKQCTLQEEVENLNQAANEEEVGEEKQKKKSRSWRTAVKSQGSNVCIYQRVEFVLKKRRISSEMPLINGSPCFI